MSARHSKPKTANARNWGYILGNTVFVTVGLVIAAWALFPVYGSTRYLATIALAIVAGAVITLLCLVLRRGAGTALLMAAGVYILGGLLVAIPGATSSFDALLDGGLELVRGPVLGWKDIVTLPLPLGEYRATLIPVFALFLTASTLAIWAAVRAKRLSVQWSWHCCS